MEAEKHKDTYLYLSFSNLAQTLQSELKLK